MIQSLDSLEDSLDNRLPHLSTLLPKWIESSKLNSSKGKVATYIPELASAQTDALAISLLHKDGHYIEHGDTNLVFTLQSISKVFTLLLALIDHGEEVVFSKVGMEPTGDSFNSMLKLELVQPGIPFNPLINAGAIAISSLIKGDNQAAKLERVLQFFRTLANNDSLQYNKDVYESELKTADLNRSIAYFLKDKDIFTQDVEDVLEVYFHHCSIDVTCKDLAHMALVLALNGKHPTTGEQLIPKRFAQIAKSFMVTCGMYNESGEFAINVGLPAKSGVAGGILTFIPGEVGIGIVGPALSAKGNSVAGVHLLETLSNHYDLNMF